MTLLEKKLEDLNSLDQNWLQTVSDEIKSKDTPSTPDLVKNYNQLWDILRESYKKNQAETIKTFKTYVGENNGNWLLEDIENSLKIYFSLENLRQNQTEKPEKVKQLIDYLFENVILYYDPQFINDYQEFHYEKKSQFWSAAKALDGLTDYYIKHHYTEKAIIKDLEMETGLNTDLCTYIENIIKKNYQTLHLNYIIDSLPSKQG